MKLNVLRNEYFFSRFVFPIEHPTEHPTEHPSHFSPHPNHLPSNPIQPPFTHPSNTPSNAPPTFPESHPQPPAAHFSPHISPFHHPHVNHPPFKPFKIPSPCNPNVNQCKRFVFPPPSTHIPPNSLIFRFLLPFPLSSSLSHFVFTPLLPIWSFVHRLPARCR